MLIEIGVDSSSPSQAVEIPDGAGPCAPCNLGELRKIGTETAVTWSFCYEVRFDAMGWKLLPQENLFVQCMKTNYWSFKVLGVFFVREGFPARKEKRLI